MCFWILSEYRLTPAVSAYQAHRHRQTPGQMMDIRYRLRPQSLSHVVLSLSAQIICPNPSSKAAGTADRRSQLLSRPLQDCVFL